jgi:hypothetical protein
MATLTITTTAAQDTRISAAFGENFNGNATGAQVKADIIEYIKQRGLSYELRQAAATAQAGVTVITPT